MMINTEVMDKIVKVVVNAVKVMVNAVTSDG